MPYLEDRPHPSPRWWAYAEQFTTRYDREWERAIRNWRYVLIERFNGSREFYDLTDDPLQKTNLLKRTLTSSQRTRLNKLDYFLDTLLATR